MYGSRPSNMDSLVVPSRDYYKYEELSDTNIGEEEVRGETTQSAEAVLAGEMRGGEVSKVITWTFTIRISE